LAANSSGGNNVAIGYQAGLANSTGGQSTLIGSQAGLAGTDLDYVTAVGYQALSSVTSGDFNTALGAQALKANTSASYNTALGYQAGYTNITGAGSTYLGYSAGYSATGASNTFVGAGAGDGVTSGAKNSILGRYNGNQSGIDIRTGSNYVVLSDGDGNPVAYTYNGATFCLQGAGYPQTGTGITFPATQSASSDANTLDDYEEGTFTATLTCTTSGTITLGYNTLYYTKIGRQVSILGYLGVNSVSSPVGNVQLNGLPFTVFNGNVARPVLNIAADGLTAGATTALMGTLDENTTRGQINKFSAGTQSGLAGNVQAGSWFTVSATYFTS